MKEIDYKLFTELVKLKKKDLKKVLFSFLEDYYNEVKKTKSFIYAIGDIPILLVAHMDTVFERPPIQIFYDSKKETFWSPEGLGADDKAGIYLIIKIIKAGYKPYILFTDGEEDGGTGVIDFCLAYPKPPKDLKFIIELDRMGYFDAVFYNCNNKDFINYIKQFGFCFSDGIFSDISILCPEWEIAGVNLSVGYFNEHSYIEYFNSLIAEETFNKVLKILSQKDWPQFKYIELPSWDTLYYKCNGCNKIFKEYELIPVDNGYYCPDCAVDKVEWCQKCGRAFLKNGINKICYKCIGESNGS